VKTTLIVPTLLASMTLVVLLGNAFPAAQRKRLLQHEQRLLLHERNAQAARRTQLAAEFAALRSDAFYVERLYSETWATIPHGALELDEANHFLPPRRP
jgi:hypothetical protein